MLIFSLSDQSEGHILWMCFPTTTFLPLALRRALLPLCMGHNRCSDSSYRAVCYTEHHFCEYSPIPYPTSNLPVGLFLLYPYDLNRFLSFGFLPLSRPDLS